MHEFSDKESERDIFGVRALIRLIVPLMVGLFLDLIVGMIDSVMLSGNGEAAVSGVSLVDTLIQLLINIYAALAAGGAIIAGQYLGAKNRKKAIQAADEMVWLNALISLGTMFLAIALREWLLRKCFGSIADDVYAHAKGYFDVVVFSIPAIGLYESGKSILRTMNDTKTTMVMSLIMNAINIVGNSILIYGMGMAARGAAISTLISRWTAVIVVMLRLFNKNRELYISKTLRHRFDAGISKAIFAMGVPGGIENGIFQLGKIVILGLVASFGTSAITANAVTQTITSIEVIPGSAVSLAAVAVIARTFGTGDYEYVRKCNRRLILISYVLISVFTMILIPLIPAIHSLYHLSSETSQLAKRMFMWHAIGAVLLWSPSFILPASLRATGDVRFPMIVSIVNIWLLRYGGAYLLAKVLQMGPSAVWIAMALIDWGGRAILFFLRWHSGGWMRGGTLKP